MKRHRAFALTGAALLATVVVGGITSMFRTSEDAMPPQPAPASSGPTIADLEITQLTTTGNASRAAISPDGKYVAYIQQDGVDTSLWIRQVATESNLKIVPAATGVTLTGVSVTPDGNFVDFVRNQSGTPPSLWRVPFLAGTTEPRKLVERIHSSIGWAPDGRKFAFIRTNNAAGEDQIGACDLIRILRR